MPREAKLFLSSSGSAARGFLRFRAVPGEHSASMDNKCSEITQADRAGDRSSTSLGAEHSEESQAGERRPKECEQAI
jgi:hypothetical protein